MHDRVRDEVSDRLLQSSFVDFDDDQRERVLKLVRTFAYLNDDEATEGGKSDEELDQDAELDEDADEDEPSFETTDITKS